jgi:hypothetical protein
VRDVTLQVIQNGFLRRHDGRRLRCLYPSQHAVGCQAGLAALSRQRPFLIGQQRFTGSLGRQAKAQHVIATQRLYHQLACGLNGQLAQQGQLAEWSGLVGLPAESFGLGREEAVGIEGRVS